MVVAGLVVDCGTRHRPVVVVAPTVVVVACTVLVVVVGGRVVVGGSSRMTPDGPAGPGGPCAPGAPVAPGGPAGTVVEGRDEVDDGTRPDDNGGGWVLTGGSDVGGPGSSRLAVVMPVATANDPASSAAATHHSRAVCRACPARTMPIRRLPLMVPGGPAPAAQPPTPNTRHGRF